MTAESSPANDGPLTPRVVDRRRPLPCCLAVRTAEAPRHLKDSTLGPRGFDQFGDPSAVADVRTVHTGDLRHSVGTADAAPGQGLLRQFTQEVTSVHAATTCFDIDGPKQVIG